MLSVDRSEARDISIEIVMSTESTLSEDVYKMPQNAFYLEKSVPIQLKTSQMLPKVWQNLGDLYAESGQLYMERALQNLAGPPKKRP